MPLLYLALGLLAIMAAWGLYKLKRKKDPRRREGLPLNSATEVERVEVRSAPVRDPGLDEDDPNAPDHVRAHKFCRSNRELIRKSETCGCFHCASIVSSRSVSSWCDEDQTGLCPQCGVDSLVPAAAGFPMNQAFMKKMRRFWFDKPQGPK
jgi:hypothetical protein